MLGVLYVALKVRYAEYGGWNSAACTWVFRVWVPIYKPPSKTQAPESAANKRCVCSRRPEPVRSHPLRSIHHWNRTESGHLCPKTVRNYRPFPEQDESFPSLFDSGQGSPNPAFARVEEATGVVFRSAPPHHPRRRDTPDLHSRNDRRAVSSRKGFPKVTKAHSGTFFPFPRRRHTMRSTGRTPRLWRKETT